MHDFHNLVIRLDMAIFILWYNDFHAALPFYHSNHRKQRLVKIRYQWKNERNERNVPQTHVETLNSLKLVVHSMTDICQMSLFPFKVKLFWNALSFNFFFFQPLCTSRQKPSFLTWDRSHFPCIGGTGVLTTGPPGKSPGMLLVSFWQHTAILEHTV